jgi:hypothetical protein
MRMLPASPRYAPVLPVSNLYACIFMFHELVKVIPLIACLSKRREGTRMLTPLLSNHCARCRIPGSTSPIVLLYKRDCQLRTGVNGLVIRVIFAQVVIYKHMRIFQSNPDRSRGYDHYREHEERHVIFEDNLVIIIEIDGGKRGHLEFVAFDSELLSAVYCNPGLPVTALFPVLIDSFKQS